MAPPDRHSNSRMSPRNQLLQFYLCTFGVGWKMGAGPSAMYLHSRKKKEILEGKEETVWSLKALPHCLGVKFPREIPITENCDPWPPLTVKWLRIGVLGSQPTEHRKPREKGLKWVFMGYALQGFFVLFCF